MVSTTAISAGQEQQYAAADVDGDGYLSEEEFTSAFPNEDFATYDKSNGSETSDGKVSKEEYQNAILDMNKSMAESMWKMAMKMFGLDKVKKADLGNPELNEVY